MPFLQKKVPDYNKYTYTGWKLLEEFDKDAHILDIGCGYNLFKPHCKNLYGIDPYNKEADEMISFEDYIPHKNFDIFLALGSLNFYDETYVELQIKHLSEITKSGDIIFWRQSMGDNPNFKKAFEQRNIRYNKINRLPEEEKSLSFFPWDWNYNKYFVDKYGFELLDFKEESGINYPTKLKGLRYYAKWSKK